MSKKIKHVALYGRKSRDGKESLEGQLLSNVEICDRNEWTYEIFKEEGSASSENWDRPELQRMIKLIEKQHFDAVVVTEQSRICRTDDFPKFRNVLQETNCLFVTTQTNQVYDYTKPEDEFVSDIMTAVNKQEIAFTKIRLKRGTIQSAKKGNWLGKKNPIGYKYNKDTKKLELSDDAPIIRRMFTEYLNGRSTKDIATLFEFENVNTSVGMIWTPAGVSRLLSNPVYVGHSLYGKTTQKKVNGKRVTRKTKRDEWILMENTHEGIITQEEWNEVQRLKKNRNSKPLILRLARHKFSGLIKCSLCGKVHSFQTARGKLRISSCQTRHYEEGSFTKYTLCPNKGANLEDFEKLFFIEFKNKIDELENYIHLIKQKDNSNKNNPNENISMFERQLKKIDQDIKRVQQGFTMEIYTAEEAQKEIKGFRAQKENIEMEIQKLKEQSNDSTMDYLEKVLKKIKNFLNGHNDMPESEANEILTEFVDTIIYKKVGKQNAEIELKIIWKQ